MIDMNRLLARSLARTIAFVIATLAIASALPVADVHGQTETPHELKTAALEALGQQRVAGEWEQLVRLHKWSDATGGFSVWAKYLGNDPDRDTVKLLKIWKAAGTSQGAEIEVPMSKLGAVEIERVKRISALQPKVDALTAERLEQDKARREEQDRKFAEAKSELGESADQFSESEIRWIVETTDTLQAAEARLKRIPSDYKTRVLGLSLCVAGSRNKDGTQALSESELQSASKNQGAVLSSLAEGRPAKRSVAAGGEINDRLLRTEIAEAIIRLFHDESQLTPEEHRLPEQEQTEILHAKGAIVETITDLLYVYDDEKKYDDLVKRFGSPHYYTDAVRRFLSEPIGKVPVPFKGETTTLVEAWQVMSEQALSNEPFLASLAESAPAEAPVTKLTAEQSLDLMLRAIEEPNPYAGKSFTIVAWMQSANLQQWDRGKEAYLPFVYCGANPIRGGKQVGSFTDLDVFGRSRFGIVFGDNDTGREAAKFDSIKKVELGISFERVRRTLFDGTRDNTVVVFIRSMRVLEE